MAALAATGATGLSACGAAPHDRQLQLTTLAAAQTEINRLAQARERTAHATWNWSQTLVHCAQSIEFSLVGFPAPKSALFQNTLGSAALAVFRWRGRMTHDLAEPIPGAPALDAQLAAELALARLNNAIQTFMHSNGPLKPHFAYGALDKADYEAAHAMHVANHLSFFSAQG